MKNLKVIFTALSLLPISTYANVHKVDAKFKLGQSLFFDKVISGNKNISCATCHHPFTGSSDGLSLGSGEGAKGIGVTRDTGDGSSKIHARIPRNAPALWNLGEEEYITFFHDGRVEKNENYPSGFKSPQGKNLPEGMDSGLAVQALFPITSSDEMAGQEGENTIADQAKLGNIAGAGGVWEQVVERVANISAYVEAFKEAYPEVSSSSDINITHLGNAIAHYEANAFVAKDSPYDRYLKGELSAMTPKQIKGMKLFNGKANCMSCHSGLFQTDHSFHSIAMPQIGPGKGHGKSKLEDYGREGVTNQKADRYKFRTPSLRNVALTAPYGHDGAYESLEAVIRHHLSSVNSIMSYKIESARLIDRSDLNQTDMLVMNNDLAVKKIILSNSIPEMNLNNDEIDSLVQFMNALTDLSCLDMSRSVPRKVLSGMSIVE